MAGFLNRRRRPGEATSLFAPARELSQSWFPLVFEPAPADVQGVKVEGDLGSVPEEALHAMMDLLRREEDGRRASRNVAAKAVHGASR